MLTAQRIALLELTALFFDLQEQACVLDREH
jgi:hypothetical protein